MIWSFHARVVEAVPCPFCHVPAGVRCFNVYAPSGPTRRPHVSRIDAYWRNA